MLMSSFFKINHSLNLSCKNRRSRFQQKMIKAKNDNVRAKTCMIEKIMNTLLNLSNHQIEMQSTKKKWLKDTILKSREFFFVIKKIIDIDILNDIKTENCKSKNNNDKKSDNEKTAKNDISNIKFANMTNLRSFKYANMFINKTFNNSFWRNVIYDSNCNDSFIYDLNRFVNEVTFAHEIIDTLNDFMLIKEYEIMLSWRS
jgi:hypothetical protein